MGAGNVCVQIGTFQGLVRGTFRFQLLGLDLLHNVWSTFIHRLTIFSSTVPSLMLDIGDSAMSKTDARGAQNLMWEPGRITCQGGSQEGRDGESQRPEETM